MLLKVLAEKILSVFRRFPFAIITSLTGTYCGIQIITGGDFPEILMPILLVSILGLPLFVSFTLFAEKNKWKPLHTLIPQAIFLVILGFYAWFLYKTELNREAIRYFVFVAAAYFSLVFLPFINTREENGFWQFNRHFFGRIINTIFYGIILFGGISLTLLTIDYLKLMQVDEDLYLKIWVFIVGIFGVWYFLTGVPKNLDSFETEREYPKAIKFLAEYILLPLITLYTAVLYVYGGVILFKQEWPEGNVSIFILIYAAVGIFATFLNPENRFLKIFSKWFYILLFPLIAMLFGALYVRVSDYGITENRYFIFILGIWLFCAITYYLFYKKKNIIFIPASLGILILLTAFGPWGALAVSEQSQVSRLENLLVKNEILVDGKIEVKPREVPPQDRKEISAIVRYLDETHDFSKIEPWFTEDIQKAVADKNFNPASQLVSAMGLSYVNEYDYDYASEYEKTHFNFRLNEKFPRVQDVAGYDYFLPDGMFFYRMDQRRNTFITNNETFIAEFDIGKNLFHITKNGETLMAVNVNEMAQKLSAQYSDRTDRYLPEEELTVISQVGRYKIKVVLEISGTNNGEITVETIRVMHLLIDIL